MKMMRSVAIAAVLLLPGCATPVQMVPTGGSRSEGTINMSFEYSLYKEPVIDPNQATMAANQACGGWGYSGSRPFGAETTKCEAMASNGTCTRFMVTVAFECTGAPSASR
jgi:hypothetical protein